MFYRPPLPLRPSHTETSPKEKWRKRWCNYARCAATATWSRPSPPLYIRRLPRFLLSRPVPARFGSSPTTRRSSAPIRERPTRRRSAASPSTRTSSRTSCSSPTGSSRSLVPGTTSYASRTSPPASPPGASSDIRRTCSRVFTPSTTVRSCQRRLIGRSSSGTFSDSEGRTEQLSCVFFFPSTH